MEAGTGRRGTCWNFRHHDPPTPSFTGSFTFSFPTLVSGNPYEVRVKTQPTNPVQVCTVTNASGTIEDANVTNIEVRCV